MISKIDIYDVFFVSLLIFISRIPNVEILRRSVHYHITTDMRKIFMISIRLNAPSDFYL